MELLLKEETGIVIGICLDVHKHLGHGFLEIVYKDALELEFRRQGIPYEREKEFDIRYKDVILSRRFYSDFLVFDQLIVEIKAADGLAPEHQAQLLNYLRASGHRVGIIFNFGRLKLEWKRMVY
jgi:GxxExxY protein